MEENDLKVVKAMMAPAIPAQTSVTSQERTSRSLSGSSTGERSDPRLTAILVIVAIMLALQIAGVIYVGLTYAAISHYIQSVTPLVNLAP